MQKLFVPEGKLLHGPAAKLGKDNASAVKSKLGLKLFAVYALIYAGFVVINMVDPNMMEMKIVAGLNLAVVYGFGLIILAIIMGIIYNGICTNCEDSMNKPEKNTEKGGEK